MHDNIIEEERAALELSAEEAEKMDMINSSYHDEEEEDFRSSSEESEDQDLIAGPIAFKFK